MAISLFGFTIAKEDKPELLNQSIVTPPSEDGASTVSVDGVADTLLDRAGNATAASDIVEDGMVIMIFDGTNWRLAGI